MTEDDLKDLPPSVRMARGFAEIDEAVEAGKPKDRRDARRLRRAVQGHTEEPQTGDMLTDEQRALKRIKDQQKGGR